MVATECAAMGAEWMAGATTWGRMMWRIRNQVGSKRGDENRHRAGGKNPRTEPVHIMTLVRSKGGIISYPVDLVGLAGAASHASDTAIDRRARVRQASWQKSAVSVSWIALSWLWAAVGGSSKGSSKPVSRA